MDGPRSVPPGPPRPTGTGPAAPPAEGAPPAVRVLPVTPGQTVQATVAQVLGGGRVLLGWRGALFEASTRLNLVPGRSYEFTVASAGESVVLSTARPLAPPDARAAAAAGLLGPQAAPLTEALRGLAEVLARMPAGAAGSDGAKAPPPGGLVLPPAGRAPSAEHLQALHQSLGHDQEARVLRLEQLPPQKLSAELAVLRHTAKAEALRLLDEKAVKVQEPVRRAAGELVDGLNRVESDNARRAEQGSPAWLPLPVVAGGPLRDARMFLLAAEAGPDGGADAATGQRPFTVVLLLDLTRLGELRVDVQVTGARVSATFLPIRSATTHVLVGAMPVLRRALENAGLEPGQLHVRNAPDHKLPVADLVAFPTTREGMVDLHA